MPAVQPELFTRDWGSEFLDALLKRMPRQPIITVSAAAAWLNKSNTTIGKLCENGEFVAADVSTGKRHAYDIETHSIIRFYKRRLGITEEKSA